MERFAGFSVAASAERALAAGRVGFGKSWSPDRLAIAPGRIELLGNHLDYNGGPVLAAAIDRFVVVAASATGPSHSTLRLKATEGESPSVVAIDAIATAEWRNPTPPPRTSDYARGLLAALNDAHVPHHLPTSLAIAGDVPIGMGVSSSAALCVAMTLALAAQDLSSEQTVLLAQEAEHRAGTPCGTMDQSASVAGGVIAFDGATLAVERLSPALGDLVFAVVDSGVERSLGASSYPTRVVESRRALDIARQAISADIPSLAAVTPDQLATLEARGLLDPVLAKRVRHIVEETARVAAGRLAMLRGDWQAFGRLMTASGGSSAHLYEISHPDVETLVSTALGVPGVLGARMMGGGEGGAALVLLASDAAAPLEAALRRLYFQPRQLDDRLGLMHLCRFAPGAAVAPFPG